MVWYNNSTVNEKQLCLLDWLKVQQEKLQWYSIISWPKSTDEYHGNKLPQEHNHLPCFSACPYIVYLSALQGVNRAASGWVVVMALLRCWSCWLRPPLSGTMTRGLTSPHPRPLFLQVWVKPQSLMINPDYGDVWCLQLLIIFQFSDLNLRTHISNALFARLILRRGPHKFPEIKSVIFVIYHAWFCSDTQPFPTVVKLTFMAC